MAVTNPPLHLSNDGANADGVRRFIHKVFGGRRGVFGTSDFFVTQKSTPTMAVTVAPGAAVVAGTQANAQGAYYVEAETSTDLTVDASDGTNPRRDLVVAHVYDSDYGGTDDRFALEVVKGTAAAVPTDPPTPSNCVILARITVPAGASAITDADLTNFRTSHSDNNQAGYVTGLGGVVVCTSTNRPLEGRYQGMVIFETDTNYLRSWTGAAWAQVWPVDSAGILDGSVTNAKITTMASSKLTGNVTDAAVSVSGMVTGSYIKTTASAGQPGYAKQRYAGTLNASGAAAINHAVSSAHLRVGACQFWYRGAGAEAYPLTVDQINGDQIFISGGLANVAFRGFIEFTDDVWNW